MSRVKYSRGGHEELSVSDGVREDSRTASGTYGTRSSAGFDCQCEMGEARRNTLASYVAGILVRSLACCWQRTPS